MGPVAGIVERSGGSVARIFRRAELPMRLIDEPDRLILLKDQLNLVEGAAREIGDDGLAARLSTEAGFASLGPYGKRIEAAPRLDQAIIVASATIGAMLQSRTRLALTVSSGVAKWTYGVTDRIEVGRQKNEMLAFGYMLDLIRCFAGAGWTPPRVELPGPPLAARAAVEKVFRCDLSRGETATIVFPAELLEMPNPRAQRIEAGDADELPDPEDLVACIAHLISLGLLEGRPTVNWISNRLQISRRSLHRRLAARGASFEGLMRRILLDRSSDLLKQASVTAAALDLGYADPAHFSRAFRRWTGESPREWRRAQAYR